MSIKTKLPLALTALLFSAGLALAQAPAPAPAPAPGVTAKAPAKKPGGRKKASTPEGIQCSAEADAKGLRGKERRSFRSKCIAGLRKGAGKGKKG